MNIHSSTIEAAFSFISVTNPFDGVEVGTVVNIPPEGVQMLIDSAKEGARVCHSLSRHERARVLEACASMVERDKDTFADLIVAEAGKTIRQAKREVLRCVNTLKLSADEARRNGGEVVPFDAYAGSENRQGWFTREPLGIIVAITPYNDPLNLVAHKLGPAIAGGNAVVLKPSELAPLSAIKLVNYLVAAGMPSNIVSVATGGAALGEALVSSRDVRMVSFTGGFATGEKIARSAGLKKLAMDLGGNAPVIVMGDCDLEDAVASCVSGAYWAAGQNCIGTQRILIQSSVYEAFRKRFVARTQALKVGNPALPDTDVGPMITAQSAARTKAVVDAAIRQGARLLCGNTHEGSVYAPTVLEDVSFTCDLWKHEAFSPVVVLQRIETLDEALALANSPDYSLHAGIFTNDLHAALKAADKLEAGGVMINDSSDYRFDAMPFGGFKYGSLGREGVRFAYEEMTQTKVVCIRKSDQ
ncbi:UNVERIFIED_ORG: acyl-CoA reductase-like NAD-dependent aldehyde dehydrogenase [Burkholderia sp. CF145]|jgi:acyl-CoA reductase-like NAD-dependent aldehyde dehydrogenase|uniref:aldehyde dehydrogenase family protein n=1 Tax=Paraburkholderia hospita TaxID=169430 RepID=UPI000271B5E4|nr:aldehyde dehydrogenase family protein [Paraburkholderia hospita]EUC19100.1 Lactaldehyde dehydrogenase [Burkholderia sp. BT03]SKC64014.1 Acyl-CoA reductase [Paraburkholderia hospita]